MNEDIEEMNKIVTAAELMERNPVLNEPVVEGLLRRGEIANIVAAPKADDISAAAHSAIMCLDNRA